jgi:hypothetical protein
MSKGAQALGLLMAAIDWWEEEIKDEVRAERENRASTYDASDVAEWFFSEFIPEAIKLTGYKQSLLSEKDEGDAEV